MMRGTKVLLFASAAVIAGASFLSAERREEERRPRDGACFYADADYEGPHFCADVGESVSSLPSSMNDRISSIRVYGRAEVAIFSQRRFQGSSRRLYDDVRNLRSADWNDRISSLRVGRGSARGDRDRGDARRSSRYRGEDPDRVVRRAYQDILDRKPDSAGLRLYRSHIVDDGWTEAQVRDALRDSREYRQMHTMTREKARAIVRSAYRAVLHREPDPGSRAYVDKVLHDKWTQGDVERELRKSPEYRNRRR